MSVRGQCARPAPGRVGGGRGASRSGEPQRRCSAGGRFLAGITVANDGAKLGRLNLGVAPHGDGRWQITIRDGEQADERWLLDESDGAATLTRIGDGP